MDALHRPDEYPFISDLVDVREFFEEGHGLFNKMVSIRLDDVDVGEWKPADREEELAARMGCPKEVIGELSDLCDPEKLRCGLENVNDPLAPIIPDEGKQRLVTLEIQSRELEKRKNKLSYRQMACQLHKYKRTNWQILDSIRDNNEMEGVKDNYMPSDVIMIVSFTKPYNRVLEYHEIRLGRLLQMDQTFQVLGQLPLTALRDKISCVCDWSVMHDRSEEPDVPFSTLSKDVYPSGFFYINGTFYNDTREPGSFELSTPIIEWAKRRTHEVGPFTTASMQDTRFIDLKLRLGQPYLYLHQGTCEHLMIFTDLRMVSSSDSQDLAQYPLLISLKPKKRTACQACKIYTAKWVTFQHSGLPFDPGFWCDACYRIYNYDKEGNKVGTFKAMPFFDRSILT